MRRRKFCQKKSACKNDKSASRAKSGESKFFIAWEQAQTTFTSVRDRGTCQTWTPVRFSSDRHKRWLQLKLLGISRLEEVAWISSFLPLPLLFRTLAACVRSSMYQNLWIHKHNIMLNWGMQNALCHILILLTDLEASLNLLPECLCRMRGISTILTSPIDIRSCFL